jgi:hypothetical protein
MDHELIYKLSTFFAGACLGKVPRQKCEKVIAFYEKLGIPYSDLGSPEYSAYAIFNGWIENIDLFDIENDYKVYTSQLPQVAREMWKLLQVYEKLARKKNIFVPQGFRDFRDRIRFGVTDEELPLVRLRGIGRETTRKIKDRINTVHRRSLGYKGTLVEILVQMYKKLGESKFMEELQYIKGVGRGKRSQKILDLVKSKM